MPNSSSAPTGSLRYCAMPRCRRARTSAGRSSMSTGASSAVSFIVGGQGEEAGIVDGYAHGEVVQHLEAAVGQAQHVVVGVVEEAADAGAAPAGGFGLERDDGAEHGRLPVQGAVGG